MIKLEGYDWDWSSFRGSETALGWNLKEIAALDEAVRLVPGRRCVVQAGGNLGIFPKRLAQSFEAVYTFEPDPDNFLKMTHNAPEENIVRFQAALGRERKLISMSRKRLTKVHLPPHEGISYVAGPGIIPTLKIDDLGLEVCDLIYLDVEGYESEALYGAEATLRRCKPVVVSESRGSDNARKVDEFLGGLGFVFARKVGIDSVFVHGSAA